MKPIPLIGGRFYHIYNRGNNGETIFRTDENYRYFLQLFAKHVEPVAATYAFCLLPNHFHVLNYVRTDEEQRIWQIEQGCQLSDSAFLSGRDTRIRRADVLTWFGGSDDFLALHQTDVDERSLAAVIVAE